MVSLGAGAAVTFVYDLFRIFRRVIPHGNIWIAFEDFFFWLGTALWSFYIFYMENNGEIRLYAILAMGAGMLVYHWLISEQLVKMVSSVLKCCFHFSIIPVRIFANQLKKFSEAFIIKFRYERRHRQEKKGSD